MYFSKPPPLPPPWLKVRRIPPGGFLWSTPLSGLVGGPGGGIFIQCIERKNHVLYYAAYLLIILYTDHERHDNIKLFCHLLYDWSVLFKFRNQRTFGLFLFCNVSKKYISIFIVLFPSFWSYFRPFLHTGLEKHRKLYFFLTLQYNTHQVLASWRDRLLSWISLTIYGLHMTIQNCIRQLVVTYLSKKFPWFDTPKLRPVN